MTSLSRAGSGVHAARSGSAWDTILAFLVMFAVAFVPSGIFYFYPVSSPTTGMILVCLLLVALAMLNLINLPRSVRLVDYMALVGVICVGLVGHLVVATFFHSVEFERMAQSVAFLMLFLAGALLIGTMLWERSAGLEPALALMRILFVVMAIFGYFRIQPEQLGIAVSVDKSVFPYAEPSHFALAFLPFLLHACVRSHGWQRYAWLAISLVIGYSLQNMTMIVGTAVAAAISVPITRSAVIGVAALALIPLLDLNYFLQRLDFALDSGGNMSSLIYRQGWELVIDAMQRTYGWGIGFQQLGFVPFYSPSADILYGMLRDDSNLRDGGFLAAKILSELGIFGAVILIAYLYVVLRLSRRLRNVALGLDPLPSASVLLAQAMVCVVVVEFFVRGLGYFSEGVMFCISGLVMLSLMPDTATRPAP